MELFLKKAGIEDCKEIHGMQVQAFDELLHRYQDYDTSPAAESLEKIEQKMVQDCTDYYFICLNDQRIGAIRIVRKKDDTCRIAPMFLLPEYQGRGYAQQAILKAEALYPQAARWELDTIKQETKLCYLYEKMGYKATGQEESIQDGMTIIYYAKSNQGADHDHTRITIPAPPCASAAHRAGI